MSPWYHTVDCRLPQPFHFPYQCVFAAGAQRTMQSRLKDSGARGLPGQYAGLFDCLVSHQHLDLHTRDQSTRVT